MAFYVPLGPRGMIFRLGTFIIGVVGGLAYWRASRRRVFVPIPIHNTSLPDTSDW